MRKIFRIEAMGVSKYYRSFDKAVAIFDFYKCFIDVELWEIIYFEPVGEGKYGATQILRDYSTIKKV